MTDREIKSRIKNITDTVKITKAMQMIATTKIYGFQSRRDNAYNYLLDVKKAADVATPHLSEDHEFFKEKTSDRSAFIVITGDKGLCGDYNAQVLNLADAEIAKHEGKPKIFIIGFVGREYYKGKPCSLVGTFIHHQLDPVVMESKRMADEILELFLKSNFRDLYVIYTKVEGMGNTTPVCEKVLPFEYVSEESNATILGDMDYEVFLKELLIAKLYYCVCSSALAVNYKRMAAMQQATINGEEMIDELQVQFNRTRQDKITNELNDAVSATLNQK